MEIMESVSLICKQIDVPAHVHFGFMVIVVYFMDEEQRIGNDNFNYSSLRNLKSIEITAFSGKMCYNNCTGIM